MIGINHIYVEFYTGPRMAMQQSFMARAKPLKQTYQCEYGIQRQLVQRES